MKYTVLGVQAGNGAVLYPFTYRVLGNIETRGVFKTPGDKQWKANFPDKPLVNDFYIQESFFGVKPDVIIGHPDCGHSSVLALSRGKKFSNPKENESLTQYIRAINIFKPRFFLLENLPALLNTYGEKDLQEAFDFHDLIFLQGPVSYWGNSQKSRKRLVIIGVPRGEKNKYKQIFTLPNKNKELRTFGEIDESKFYPTEAFCNARLPLSTEIAIFGGKKMTLREIKETWQSLPPGQKRFPANKDRMKYAPGVYRNIRKETPLTVRKGNREFDEFGNVLTPRQRARIQGFPDKFVIYGETDKRLGFWITKANITVTKCFPYEISLWFKSKLKLIYK